MLTKIIKEWGDKNLPIEKRVELLKILNSFLNNLNEENKLAEKITSYNKICNAFGWSKPKA